MACISHFVSHLEINHLKSKSSRKAAYSTNTEDVQNHTHSTSPSKMQNIAMQQEFFLQILLILISLFCTWSNMPLQALIGENKINIYLHVSMDNHIIKRTKNVLK